MRVEVQRQVGIEDEANTCDHAEGKLGFTSI
jgi:hypothetical protein